jgi:hypothetical protein
MDLNSLLNEMDNDLKNRIEQLKFEIEQSIWNTRKHLKESSLTKYQKSELKTICHELIEIAKLEFKELDENPVKEFIEYLDFCKIRMDELFK